MDRLEAQAAFEVALQDVAGVFYLAGCAGVLGGMGQWLHTQAAQRGTPRLWADVSLTAEPFFARHGFAVEARQQVERHGVVLRNTRMAKLLAGNCS